MSRKHLATCIGATLAFALPPSAHALITIDMQQVGADVVATGSGSAKTAALTRASTSNASKVWPVFLPESLLIIGNAFGSNDGWVGAIDGPANFGTSTTATDATSSAGDRLGIGAQRAVHLPLNYVSGTPVSGSSTWEKLSFVDLGVTPGTYTWTWGSGATADALVLNIGSPVPEPGSIALMLAGLVAVGLRLRHRRR